MLWLRYEIFKFHKSKELEYFISFHLFLIYFLSLPSRNFSKNFHQTRLSLNEFPAGGKFGFPPFKLFCTETQKLFADHDFMSSVLFIVFSNRSFFPKKQTQCEKRISQMFFSILWQNFTHSQMRLRMKFIISFPFFPFHARPSKNLSHPQLNTLFTSFNCLQTNMDEANVCLVHNSL